MCSSEVSTRTGCRLVANGLVELLVVHTHNKCSHSFTCDCCRDSEGYGKGKNAIPETRGTEVGSAKRNINRKHDHNPSRYVVARLYWSNWKMKYTALNFCPCYFGMIQKGEEATWRRRWQGKMERLGRWIHDGLRLPPCCTELVFWQCTRNLRLYLPQTIRQMVNGRF